MEYLWQLSRLIQAPPPRSWQRWRSSPRSLRSIVSVNLKHTVRLIALWHAAVIDHNFLGRLRNLHANHAITLAAHQQPLRNLSAGKLYREWNLSASRTRVAHRDRNHVTIRQCLACECRFHLKVGEAPIAINPVVEEPLQITLRLRLDQSLHVGRFGV